MTRNTAKLTLVSIKAPRQNVVEYTLKGNDTRSEIEWKLRIQVDSDDTALHKLFGKPGDTTLVNIHGGPDSPPPVPHILFELALLDERKPKRPKIVLLKDEDRGNSNVGGFIEVAELTLTFHEVEAPDTYSLPYSHSEGGDLSVSVSIGKGETQTELAPAAVATQ